MTAGVLWVLAQPDPSDRQPAYLRIVTPGVNASVLIHAEDGSWSEVGETGLLAVDLAVSSGDSRICLVHSRLEPVCRDWSFSPGEKAEWRVCSGEFKKPATDLPLPVPARPPPRVDLPHRVVAVFLVTDESRREIPVLRPNLVAASGTPPADWEPWVEVPVLGESSLMMVDFLGGTCVCVPPELARGESYRCWWGCEE